ncbi:hypothetical protein A9977_18370 [Variovorax sp. UMC13]|nr:hypothetical protein [Variovorax sp. UMC13]
MSAQDCSTARRGAPCDTADEIEERLMAHLRSTERLQHEQFASCLLSRLLALLFWPLSTAACIALSVYIVIART